MWYFQRLLVLLTVMKVNSKSRFLGGCKLFIIITRETFISTLSIQRCVLGVYQEISSLGIVFSDALPWANILCTSHFTSRFPSDMGYAPHYKHPVYIWYNENGPRWMMPKAFLGCCKDAVGQHTQNADNASCFGSNSVRSNIFGSFLMTLQILCDRSNWLSGIFCHWHQ